jgi:hypothetical protein
VDRYRADRLAGIDPAQHIAGSRPVNHDMTVIITGRQQTAAGTKR